MKSFFLAAFVLLYINASSQWNIGDRAQAFLDISAFYDNAYELKHDTVYCYLKGKDNGWFRDENFPIYINWYTDLACDLLIDWQYRHIRIVFECEDKSKYYDLQCGGTSATTVDNRLYKVNRAVAIMRCTYQGDTLVYSTATTDDQFDAADSLHYNQAAEGLCKLVRHYVYGRPVPMQYQIEQLVSGKELYRRDF